jgi:hypothetical protein
MAERQGTLDRRQLEARQRCQPFIQPDSEGLGRGCIERQELRGRLTDRVQKGQEEATNRVQESRAQQPSSAGYLRAQGENQIDLLGSQPQKRQKVAVYVSV